MKPHPCLLIIASTLLGTFLLQAEEAVPEKSEPAPEPYKLKNRSSFTAAKKDARAPFWPIGWMPREAVVAQVAKGEAPKLDDKAFRVSSILLGSGATPSLALINGRAYGEGEFLKMPRAAADPDRNAAKPAAVRIRVHQISDGTVVLQRGEQLVTATLYRPELALKKIEEPLLEEEEP